METQQDFRKLLELFNAHDAACLIVGAHVLGRYGAPRYTGDKDILVRTDGENAGRVLRALEKFGFGSAGLTLHDFSIPDNIVQLGVPPVRIDITTSITGVSREEAWKERDKGLYGDVAVHYLGRQEFIANRRALGSKKDLADLEALGED